MLFFLQAKKWILWAWSGKWSMYVNRHLGTYRFILLWKFWVTNSSGYRWENVKIMLFLILDKGPLEKIFFVCLTVSLCIINKKKTTPFWCMLQMRRRMILMGNQTNFSSTLNLVDLLNLKVLYSQHLVSWKRNWVICKQISALRFKMMFSLLVDFMIRYGLNCMCILYMSARTKRQWTPFTTVSYWPLMAV